MHCGDHHRCAFGRFPRQIQSKTGGRLRAVTVAPLLQLPVFISSYISRKHKEWTKKNYLYRFCYAVFSMALVKWDINIMICVSSVPTTCSMREKHINIIIYNTLSFGMAYPYFRSMSLFVWAGRINQIGYIVLLADIHTNRNSHTRSLVVHKFILYWMKSGSESYITVHCIP